MVNKSKYSVLLVGLITLLSACTKPPSNSTAAPETQSANKAPTPQRSPLTELEERVQYVRNGGFTYIWVVSRKDGKPLTKEDGDYLKKNAPQVVDWVGLDDKTKFVAGTNFDLEQGNMAELKKRFVVEDYSNR